MTDQYILRLKDVWFRYDNEWVLSNINLELSPNKVIGIIGPNGGGKTTLLKLISGLEKPDKGEILIRNESIENPSTLLRIGYVPQHATVRWTFPIKVKDVILLGKINKRGKLSKANTEDKEHLLRIAESLQIDSFLDKHISELSGGQQQKVFIARALINNPELLLLDEPETGIDVAAQDFFYIILEEIKIKFRLTIMLVTHDLNVVPKLCDEVACVNQTLFHHTSPEEAVACPNFDKHYGSHLEVLIHGKNVPHRLVQEHDHDHEEKK